MTTTLRSCRLAAWINGVLAEVTHIEHRVEQIPVPSFMPEIDPMWEHIDSSNHYHAVTKDSRLPTLRWEEDSPGEGWLAVSAGHHVCVLCGERIRVGTRMPREPIPVIAGQEEWVLTVHGDESLRSVCRPERMVSVRILEDPGLFGVCSVDSTFCSYGEAVRPLFQVKLLGFLHESVRR